MADFKPMLASKADFSKLVYPLIAQPKYDGIRCCLDFGGRALSRTLKDIPNLMIQDYMRRLDAQLNGSSFGLDGELVSYTNGVMDSLYTVQSKVMSVNGEFDFTYHIFDEYTCKNVPYRDRHHMLSKMLDSAKPMRNFVLVDNHWCDNEKELFDYEDKLVADGWEGAIARKPTGFYKYGRATVNEGLLMKIKRFEDAEAVIIGYEELEHNENEAFLDERGQTKRSSHKANKVSGGVLGALLLDWNGVQFKVGTGFDAAQREYIWGSREKFMGNNVTFKYKGLGPNGKPLISSFKAFRNKIDIEHKPENVPEHTQSKSEVYQGSLF